MFIIPSGDGGVLIENIKIANGTLSTTNIANFKLYSVDETSDTSLEITSVLGGVSLNSGTGKNVKIDGFSYPKTDGSAGYVLKTDGNKTLSFGPATSTATATAFYETVVSADGLWNYTTISAALAAGKKSIFVRNGNYTETANILLSSSGISIFGESNGGVVVTLGAYAVQTPTVTVINTGTVSVTNGSSTVTGTGTVFTSLVAGNIILLGTVYYTVGSVASATSLTLTQNFVGRTQSGLAFVAHPVVKNVSLQNLTFIGGTTSSPMLLSGFQNLVMNQVTMSNCTMGGVYIKYGMNLSAVNCVFDTCSQGLSLESVVNSVAIGVQVVRNSGIGLSLTNCSRLVLESVMAMQNGSDGLRMTGCGQITCSDGIFNENIGTGIQLSSVTTQVIISGCNVIYNLANGIYINTGCGLDSVISGCRVNQNGGTGITGWTNCTISECFVNSNLSNGISFPAGASSSIVSNCEVRGNSNTGVLITTGTLHTVSNCLISESGSVGVYISTSSLVNFVGNTIKSNSGNGGMTIAADCTKVVVSNGIFSANSSNNLSNSSTTTVQLGNILN